jgi:multisubunit Na+/H+ antiporter MnhG subunit
MQEIIPTIKILPLVVSAIILFISSIGIFKSKNPLQMLHFVTIIEIICIPLAVFTLILFQGLSELKMIICIATTVILSPVTSYFISKAYQKQVTRQTTNDIIIEHQPTKIL